MNRFQFFWRYLRGKTPWDTNITPPEIVALAERLPAGRVLDIGCGTGTNVIYLAKRGWSGVGVDFVTTAIRRAKRKARAANLSKDTAQFFTADASKLDFLSGPFDLVMDIGCLHALSEVGQRAYAKQVARLTTSGSLYTLYIFHAHIQDGKPFGVAPEQIRALFTPLFRLESEVISPELDRGRPSAWYVFQRE
ncbi:MAG: class I SAM-dependent methyltransferase [Anaerolineae bacterium]